MAYKTWLVFCLFAIFGNSVRCKKSKEECKCQCACSPKMAAHIASEAMPVIAVVPPPLIVKPTRRIAPEPRSCVPAPQIDYMDGGNTIVAETMSCPHYFRIGLTYGCYGLVQIKRYWHEVMCPDMSYFANTNSDEQIADYVGFMKMECHTEDIWLDAHWNPSDGDWEDMYYTNVSPYLAEKLGPGTDGDCAFLTANGEIGIRRCYDRLGYICHYGAH